MIFYLFYKDEENFQDFEDTPERKISLLDVPLGMTKTMISATAATTTSIVSSVANKNFWKHAVGYAINIIY